MYGVNKTKRRTRYMTDNNFRRLPVGIQSFKVIREENYLLTSSSCHPKFFIKEFGDFLMPCHQHCLGVNLLVQR